jgi:hypothetical protein
LEEYAGPIPFLVVPILKVWKMEDGSVSVEIHAALAFPFTSTIAIANHSSRKHEVEENEK